MTPRFNISGDRNGNTERRPPPKPSVARTTKSPGYEARDIVAGSRNFR
jgi:hypothetical protein